MAQKHFLFFDSVGVIIGYAPGHWISSDWDGTIPPTDPLSLPEEGSHSRHVHDYMYGPSSNGTSIGGKELTCLCDEYDDKCLCAANGVNNNYVDVDGTGLLTTKPTLTILVDGVSHPVGSTSLINKSPGSWVNLQLVADIPDGHQVTLVKSDSLLSIDEIVLTFNNGSTNAVLLKAPAQGLVGRVGGVSKYVRPTIVSILGWA